MEIANRRVATIHFVMTDADGTQVTSTYGSAPLVHMYGTGGIVPALDKALAGKQPGDKFSIDVRPEEGFGPHREELVQTLPRDTYAGQSALAVGTRLDAQTQGFGPLKVVVTALDGDTITVDGNHPLAGKPFKLDVEVVDVRVATPEEIQFGVQQPKG